MASSSTVQPPSGSALEEGEIRSSAPASKIGANSESHGVGEPQQPNENPDTQAHAPVNNQSVQEHSDEDEVLPDSEFRWASTLKDLVYISEVKRIARNRYQYEVQWFKREEECSENGTTVKNWWLLQDFWRHVGGKRCIGVGVVKTAEPKFKADCIERFISLDLVDKLHAGADNDVPPQQTLIVYIKAAKIDGGVLKYLCRWFKYADNESTWEVEGNLTSAKKHIKTFWADLNINKSDFDGREVRASEENIAKYKMFFIQNEAVL